MLTLRAICLLLLVSCFFVVKSQLYIVSERGRKLLTSGNSICPPAISPTGVAIQCRTSSKAVKFYIDDELISKSKTRPFYMLDNSTGFPTKWTNWDSYLGRRRISCITENKRRYDSHVIISCARASLQQPSAEPSMELLPPAALSFFNATDPEDSLGEISTGDVICPEFFTDVNIGIRCHAYATTKIARLIVDGLLWEKFRQQPFFISRATVPKLFDVLERSRGQVLTLGCMLDDGTIYEAAVTLACKEDEIVPLPSAELEQIETEVVQKPTSDVFVSVEGCVVIEAKSATLSPGWIETATGVAFLPNDTSQFRAPAGMFALSYAFTAPLNGRYAIALDMTSAGVKRHDEVWLRFTNGLQMVGRSREGKQETGWVVFDKNDSGRSLTGSSMKSASISFATAEKLQIGTDYVVELAGRRTNVEVHRVILFNCKDHGCWIRSISWERRLASCAGLHR